MELIFIKDYKYFNMIIHKKGETKFVDDINFANYLINKGVAKPIN